MLSYTVLTDPTPLVASSTATVSLVITNTGNTQVTWTSIEVEVPDGGGANDLTSALTWSTPPRVECRINSVRRPVPFSTQGNVVVITPPARGNTFPPNGYMVVTLENLRIASIPGLAMLDVTEKTSAHPNGIDATVAVWKTTQTTPGGGRFAVGQTTPGQGWMQIQDYIVGIDVNTTSGKFTSTPKYFTSVASTANGVHWKMTGDGSIFYTLPGSFRLYLARPDNGRITVGDAEREGWYINWVGYES